MSIRCMNWAFSQVLSPPIKLTLLALADCANENGECFPSRKHLAEMTCQCVRTISSQIAELERRGLMAKTEQHREHGGQTVNLYRLVIDPLQDLQGPRATACKGKEPSYEPTLISNEIKGADAPSDDDATFYREGREILGGGSGGYLTKLKRACGGATPALEVLRHARTRDSPAEYIGAVIREKSKPDVSDALTQAMASL